ncbi:membrane dipeptidase [Pigmentiphaga sp. NML080357]|uniref:membrane dipeptidase n=1 Tax=Pigmentiphaga sp. NML080357 TaxID=2008675 RepID=UPI0011846AC9
MRRPAAYWECCSERRTPAGATAASSGWRQAFIRAGFKPQELPRIGASPAGFQAWTEWPRITAALLHAGFSEETVRGLIGGNWLRFMDRHATAGH